MTQPTPSAQLSAVDLDGLEAAYESQGWDEKNYWLDDSIPALISMARDALALRSAAQRVVDGYSHAQSAKEFAFMVQGLAHALTAAEQDGSGANGARAEGGAE